MPLPLDPYDPTLWGDPAEGVISTGQAPSVPPVSAPRAKSGGFDVRTLLALGLGTVGDAFTETLSGGKTKGQIVPLVLRALDSRRNQETEERKAEAEEKKLQLAAMKYQLDVMQFVQHGTKAQHDNFSAFTANLEKLSGTMATATPDERRFAGEGLKKFADDSGIGFAKIFVDRAMADPGLVRHLGAAGEFMKDRPGGALFLSTGQAFVKDPKKFMDEFRDFAAGEAIKELSARLPRVTGRLKQAYGDKPIPFDAVADLIAPDNEFVAQVFRGDVAVSDPIRKAMGSALARHGVELPDTAAEAEKTKAITRTRKEAEAPFEMPPLEPRTLAVLAEQKIDPRTASGEQLTAARKESDRRALDFENQKDSAKQKLAATKPLTHEETNNLRLAYRREARRVVLSTEPGGIFGAAEKLEPEQKKALEGRIDTAARDLAEKDGLGRLFPAPKPAPAPTVQSGATGRAATSADVQAALKDSNGDRARARQLLIKRGFDPGLPLANR